MRSSEIRSTFTDFFITRGHHLVPSSPLIPADPTLLLTNAGMNQFKPYFLGETVPAFTRATSVQKCARTSDIDNVGRTTRHATFFEMLGNFSFGDYFKQDAIAWSWELLTGGFNLDPARLWITVYADDDEAEQLWRRIGVPAERIQRLGMADNYWSMGVPGPCGPCSEVNYDRGPAFGREGGPAVDGERYLEIWNLVFMQNLRGEGTGKGEFPILGELPAKNIDTGMGLDRIAAILQDVDTLCETDLLAPTFRLVQELAGRPYPGRDGSEASVSFQVAAEHARSVAFLIADGVLPARDGRGYVLRRLMRRAIRHARMVGIDQPVLSALTGSVIDTLAPAWPELGQHRDLIEKVVTAEENAFGKTLRQGSKLLDGAITEARQSHATLLPGRTAFELHDTYGFPIDLTIDAARAAGLTVDEDAFAQLLEDQQRQAKQAGHGKKSSAVAQQDTYRQIAAQHGLTDFVGYEATSAEAQILALLDASGPVRTAVEGDTIEVLLNRSPFYAEAGGQVGDTGALTTGDASLQILDTRLGLDGLHVHTARVTTGEITTGQHAQAHVDARRRAAIARSHSATHVLHAMLRRVLGDHAAQQGSRVEPGRLRFDFAHFTALDPAQLAAVQTLVNDHLCDDPDVRVWEATRAQAEAAGATALFGEKYGERVRIVDIGDFSRELCGGTHVGHGSQAGPVHILAESSIGSSLRRIEALTGPEALRYYHHQHELLTKLTRLLGVPPEQAPAKLTERLNTLAETQKTLENLRATQLTAIADQLAGQMQEVTGGWVICQVIDDISADELRRLASDLTSRRPNQPGAVILASITGDNAILVAALTPALTQTGTQARQILAAAAKAVGGGAGGRPAMASAGGQQARNLRQALTLATNDATAILARLG